MQWYGKSAYVCGGTTRVEVSVWIIYCTRSYFTPLHLCVFLFTNLYFREEARDMFYHAYRAYMENAYPADELMPLSCAGRYRGLGQSRGDIDDAMGKYVHKASLILHR